ncbi:MAG TPA: aminomethyl-transferring glycine dehydrogenase [Chthoniobacterales bacterium]|nr:aminomethyl-transferring glycine dehydrogenase [Chthoniobacterales bacterium]
MDLVETEALEKTAAPEAQKSPAPRRGTAEELSPFVARHIGPNDEEIAAMLAVLGFEDLDTFIAATVPPDIRAAQPLALPVGKSEQEALAELRKLSEQNKVARSFIGAGYSDCFVPPVIQRNILENPGWYTAYTPYQAEIAQGRLEALLNFQTMITDLTALDIANASLLDEATAAAEAMTLCHAVVGGRDTFFVSEMCHPQTIEVVQTRAEPLGIQIVIGNPATFRFTEKVFGALLQYPTTDGAIIDYEPFIKGAHEAGALAIVAADILALTLLRPPGEMGADVAVGTTQRFGVPLGCGGPHAAYFATRDQYKRHLPGRLVGVSHDAAGRPAYRLALQTREQHIRRDKATSNICTAQVLLAVMASMYAVYHGPEGLRRIARRVHESACRLADGLEQLGYGIAHQDFFDTIRLDLGKRASGEFLRRAVQQNCNLRVLGPHSIGISLDETTTPNDLEMLLSIFGENRAILPGFAPASRKSQIENRKSAFLTHPVFNTHDSETEMLRYLRRLEARDLSLCHSMIPLGSCTMKLNASAEMFPVSWPEFARIHPFAPNEQTAGYRAICAQLERWLAEITGFAAVSLQPNAGSQGEYAGLLAIRGYHAARSEAHRNICLIPTSAHGTNPASAVMAGFRVVPVKCLEDGDIDLTDLRAKADAHRQDLAALMVTYPSTHGVFETTIREICQIVHEHGGQVYMDGANMNAQVGLCRPGDIGADVCHLNLHKTFCIPHGGGGPGVGPIGVAPHLVDFLPGLPSLNPQTASGGSTLNSGPVSAAPFGSASILTISWMYIRMMGPAGLTKATKVAILNANYIAQRLDSYFPVLFKGKNGLVAHECILDLRPCKSAGIEVEDVAKRLMDYGFHAPTVSWPVPGTVMIEPTESEPPHELDRFCEAMIAIRAEIDAIGAGKADPKNNVLKNAPHTAEQVTSDRWDHPYSREQAAYPAPWTRAQKFWPAVARIDSVYGDRNLFCTCPPMEEFTETR